MTYQTGLLTYQSAAQKLGKEIDHARAIAQVCDLLDAAAALAKVPLLALVAVRVSSGEINPKAWVKDAPEGVRYTALLHQRISFKLVNVSFHWLTVIYIWLTL